MLAFQENCLWTIKTDTTFKSHEVSFHLNEKTADITMDGRNVEFIVSQPQSNQWVETQTDGRVTTTITRHFGEDIMRVELKVNEVTAESTFRRR